MLVARAPKKPNPQNDIHSGNSPRQLRAMKLVNRYARWTIGLERTRSLLAPMMNAIAANTKVENARRRRLYHRPGPDQGGSREPRHANMKSDSAIARPSTAPPIAHTHLADP